MNWDLSMAPMGIQDVVNKDLSLFFGTSHETSDFLMDCLEMWWGMNKRKYSHIQELVINLDNGPSQMSGRTQFIKRMVLFAKVINLPIHLVYYPPYHSKYNPIEHTFGVLEKHWNGEILDSKEAVLGHASSMIYCKKNPVVQLVDQFYPKKIKLTKEELEPFMSSFIRSAHLPKWDILITP